MLTHLPARVPTMAPCCGSGARPAGSFRQRVLNRALGMVVRLNLWLDPALLGGWLLAAGVGALGEGAAALLRAWRGYKACVPCMSVCLLSADTPPDTEALFV